jgi:hypothetical protein
MKTLQPHRYHVPRSHEPTQGGVANTSAILDALLLTLDRIDTGLRLDGLSDDKILAVSILVAQAIDIIVERDGQ